MNDGIDAQLAKGGGPRRGPADFKDVLGDIPDQPQMSAFSIPGVFQNLNRAMDNGLTAEEAGEMLTQLAFYAGWPRVFSALPVVKDVIGKRPR